MLKYSELCSYKNIEQVFGNLRGVLLLFESKLNNGHWTCLKKLNNGIICFYDSYGFIPDDQLEYTNKQFRIDNNMNYPYLTRLLYNTKYPIDYNHYRVQKMKNGINTCGRYVAIFLKYDNIDCDTFSEWLLNQNDNPDITITKLTEPYL